MGIYINDISKNVCEHVDNAVANYLENFNELGFKMQAEDEYNTRHIYSKFNYTNDGNELLSFSYSNHFAIEGIVIGYNFDVEDNHALIIYGRCLPENNTVKETCIDINKMDNKVTMYVLNTTRSNVDKGRSLTLDDVHILPEVCDDYDIDVINFDINNESLLTGMDKVNKKRKIKVKK